MSSLSSDSELIVHTDGGARGNPGPAAIGIVIKTSSGKLLYQTGQTIGYATNNTAEYLAVVHAITWLQDHQSSLPTQTIKFFLDSNLVVNQLNGRYQIKQAHLRTFADQIQTLQSQNQFRITYHHVPRSQNHEADRLLNQALDQA